MSAQHDDEANRYVYKGTELDVFALATNWKAYWASRIETHIGWRVLEVGAGLGATARILCGNQKKWIALEPDPALARRMRTMSTQETCLRFVMSGQEHSKTSMRRSASIPSST